MKVFLGADHRGYELKEKIARWLFENNYEFEDMGAESLDPKDDYTVYAERVASMIASQPKERGILICGSGAGMTIVANKFDGVRASLGINPAQVQSARRDDDINILILAADYLKEDEALTMVAAFLETPFSEEKHHRRRLEDISKIEANN